MNTRQALIEAVLLDVLERIAEELEANNSRVQWASAYEACDALCDAPGVPRESTGEMKALAEAIALGETRLVVLGSPIRKERRCAALAVLDTPEVIDRICEALERADLEGAVKEARVYRGSTECYRLFETLLAA